MTLLEDQAERAELKVLLSDAHVAEEIRIGKHLHYRNLLATPCICYFNIKEPLGTCRMCRKTKKPKTILLNSD